MKEEDYESDKHHDTMTIREKKTGEVSISVSLTSFPIEIHKIVKEISSRGRNVSSIYSEAITSLREDYNTYKKFLVQGPPRAGPKKNTKVWISEQANEDLRFLAYSMKCFQRQIVYTAILRWINKEKDKVTPMG